MRRAQPADRGQKHDPMTEPDPIALDEHAPITEKLTPEAAVERLDEGVLHRPSWRGVVPVDPCFLAPF